MRGYKYRKLVLLASCYIDVNIYILEEKTEVNRRGVCGRTIMNPD